MQHPVVAKLRERGENLLGQAVARLGVAFSDQLNDIADSTLAIAQTPDHGGARIEIDRPGIAGMVEQELSVDGFNLDVGNRHRNLILDGILRVCHESSPDAAGLLVKLSIQFQSPPTPA